MQVESFHEDLGSSKKSPYVPLLNELSDTCEYDFVPWSWALHFWSSTRNVERSRAPFQGFTDVGCWNNGHVFLSSFLHWLANIRTLLLHDFNFFFHLEIYLINIYSTCSRDKKNMFLPDSNKKTPPESPEMPFNDSTPSGTGSSFPKSSALRKGRCTESCTFEMEWPCGRETERGIYPVKRGDFSKPRNRNVTGK